MGAVAFLFERAHGIIQRAGDGAAAASNETDFHDAWFGGFGGTGWCQKPQGGQYQRG